MKGITFDPYVFSIKNSVCHRLGSVNMEAYFEQTDRQTQSCMHAPKVNKTLEMHEQVENILDKPSYTLLYSHLKYSMDDMCIAKLMQLRIKPSFTLQVLEIYTPIYHNNGHSKDTDQTSCCTSLPFLGLIILQILPSRSRMPLVSHSGQISH